MSNTKPDSSIKTLIILLNMGGPQNKDEIHPYLKELFQDRELLKLPFQKILGRIIAWRRTPKIQERYEEIGQYSPTKKIMDDQCEVREVDANCSEPWAKTIGWRAREFASNKGTKVIEERKKRGESRERAEACALCGVPQCGRGAIGAAAVQRLCSGGAAAGACAWAWAWMGVA